MLFARSLVVLCLAALAFWGPAPRAHAKGSPPPSPCSISYLNCPTVIANNAGVLSDELINNTFDLAILGIAYSVPQLPAGDAMSFEVSGPGGGANLLPFITTAVLNAYGSNGALLFNLKLTNFDPSGAGGGGYLVPTQLSQNGVTLSETVSGFEGGFSFLALNMSGAPIRLLLDVQIRANNYGQVTVTNTYALTPVPEPASVGLLLAGLCALAAWLSYRGRDPSTAA